VDRKQLKKNISLINKHPLIAYTILEAKKSKLITDLVVSSDDNEIWIIAIQYGCKSPFKRPAQR
jgi:CMP-N,N'-diacetyllegionaminic acid synthase